MAVPPVPRSLIVCEEVVSDSTNPKRLSLLRIMHAIAPAKGSRYPLKQSSLSIFTQLTEGRGSGAMRVEFRFADTDQLMSHTKARTVTFTENEPLLVRGFNFRIQDAVFRQPGLYWVQLRFNDEVLIQTPLLLRPAATA